MIRLLKSNPSISYLVITFVISWLFWFSPIFIDLPDDIYFSIIVVGGFGPAISGLVLLHLQSSKKITIASRSLFWIVSFAFALLLAMTHYLVNNEARLGKFWFKLKDIGLIAIVILLLCSLFLGLLASNSKNNDLKENYLKSLIFDKTKIKWYVLAVLFYPVLYILGFAFGELFGFGTSESLFTPDIYDVPGFLLIFFLAGAEEFGWRGFLQKELQKKYNPLISAIIISIAWTLWHIPLHYNGFYDSGIFGRLLLSFQLGILFTWFYNKSGYSILTVMLLHTMNNWVGNIFGTSYYPAMALGIILFIFFIINNKMWQMKNYHIKFYSTEKSLKSST
ncbi:CPBP family intramembrane glutamic endopeptidase [uncultured Winogradskyella sp.]|uniref:CPBP family intramembrane glutamic endopeptidase n=1 Tax=uncultured Winogradskyella sp. TaxID=395353 RepID=UPI003516C695